LVLEKCQGKGDLMLRAQTMELAKDANTQVKSTAFWVGGILKGKHKKV